MTEELGTLNGVEEKLKKFAVAGGQDATTINQAHSLKALRDRERRIVANATQLLQHLDDELSALTGRLTQQASGLQDKDVSKGPNAPIIQEALKQLAECGAVIDRSLQDARGQIAGTLKEVATAGSRLTTSHKQQGMEFRSLIEKHQHAQGQAAERAQLERRRNDLLAKSRQRQQLVDQLTALDANRKTLLQRLSELWDERFAVREAVALRINAHLSPSIRVSVAQYGKPTAPPSSSPSRSPTRAAPWPA